MPTTFKTRCNYKSMVAQPPNATSEMVAAQFIIVDPVITGTMSITYSLSSDPYVVGDYYDVTVAQGTAPTVAKHTA